MLSPEIWDFKPPIHHTSVFSGTCETHLNIFSEVENHYFNHSVTVILPETVLVPEGLTSALTEDSVYYKVAQLSLSKFLDRRFIDSFVKSGQLTAVSVGTHIDVDDCAALTPSGHLVLNLNKSTHQTLGLEGTQSKFSTERYVVQINLKSASFVPGKKNYQRAVKCLSTLVDLQMDFLIAWHPPDIEDDERMICPSSVAAYFDELGYEVNSCSPQEWTSRQYEVPLPDVKTTEHAELLELLGAFALGVNMSSRDDSESRYLSTYEGPLDATRKTQVAVLKHQGFFTTSQISRFLKGFSSYVEKRKDLPWAALHVQGFSDSPVSWGLREHTFHSDGDNNYTLVLRPDLSYQFFKITSFIHKMKFKLH